MSPEDLYLEALRATYSLCQRKSRFTIEDLRELLQARGIPLLEPASIMAAVLQQASRLGWCAQTPERVRSERKAARGRTVAVWVSASLKTSGMALPDWDGNKPSRRKRARSISVARQTTLRAIYALCGYKDIFDMDDVRAKAKVDDERIRSALSVAVARGWCRPVAQDALLYGKGVNSWRAARVLPPWDGES